MLRDSGGVVSVSFYIYIDCTISSYCLSQQSSHTFEGKKARFAWMGGIGYGLTGYPFELVCLPKSGKATKKCLEQARELD